MRDMLGKHDKRMTIRLRKWLAGLERKEYRVFWTGDLLINKRKLYVAYLICIHTNKETPAGQHYEESCMSGCLSGKSVQ